MARIAILLDNQEGISDNFNPCGYDWDSFIWKFNEERMKCWCVGEWSLDSYCDLLEFDAIIVETYPSLSKFMIPLLELELPDRPLIIALEARSGEIACWNNWKVKTEYFSWLKKADIVVPWTYHGFIFYKPSKIMEIVRPVPPGFRKTLDEFRKNAIKQNYITSPIYLRGSTDNNILLLHALGQLTGRKVIYSIQFEEDLNFWKERMEVRKLLPLPEQCRLFANAFCGVKFWNTTSAIGGRASYMMAKLGTPYISSLALIQEILFPKLLINPYGGLNEILKLMEKLEDPNCYRDITEFALSKCAVIEEGGKDWQKLIETIRKHAAARQRKPVKSHPVKLNLGCGAEKPSGYINVDIDFRVKPTIVADMRRLPFKDEIADEILCSQILEHFDFQDLELVLAEIDRVLKPKGKLISHTPWIPNLVRDLSLETSLDDLCRISNSIFGEDQIARGLHRIAFHPAFFREFLRNFQLEVCEISGPILHCELSKGAA